jgi:hypothetical protein
MRDVSVESVEGSLNPFAVVALPGGRQVLDAWKGMSLVMVGRRPFLGHAPVLPDFRATGNYFGVGSKR